MDLANGIPSEYGAWLHPHPRPAERPAGADRAGPTLTCNTVTLLPFLGCTSNSHEVAQLMGDGIRILPVSRWIPLTPPMRCWVQIALAGSSVFTIWPSSMAGGPDLGAGCCAHSLIEPQRWC